MSCNYAEGLSPYENKGVLGLPESFDTQDELERKCALLAKFIGDSKHVVVHTGAGISTSAGIPDFRGPNGVWTLERKGLKPTTNTSFAEAKPTKTHMALKKLVDVGKIHYIVSQNIDGLHLKSGLNRNHVAELHGNMFVDECNICRRKFVRSNPSPTVGRRTTGEPCPAGSQTSRRPCRGKLYDDVLDWEHSLPENDQLMAEMHSGLADLSICLGTTLQIVPSGNMPLETLKYGGKLVICNLQPTKHNNKADLIINYYVDDVMERIMKQFQLEIPAYEKKTDPTQLVAFDNVIHWNISREDIVALQLKYKQKCKGFKIKRALVKKRDENNVKISKIINNDDLKVLNDIEKMVKKENVSHDVVKNESDFVTNDLKYSTVVCKSENIAEVLVKSESKTEDSIKTENGVSIKNESKIED